MNGRVAILFFFASIAGASLFAGDGPLKVDQPGKLGSIKIELVSGSITKIKVKAKKGKETQPTKEYLVLRVRLTNEGKEKFVPYLSWTGDPAPAKKRMEISDEFGNRYKAWSSKTAHPVGVLLTARIDPEKSVEDLLVFEAPVANAKELTVTLDGWNLQKLSSKITFKVPREFFDKKTSTKDK